MKKCWVSYDQFLKRVSTQVCGTLLPQIREQMSVSDLHLSTVEFLAYKKKTKTWKIEFPPPQKMFSKCFQNVFFLPTKCWKNHPQKLLIIGPNLLFHSPAQPTANSPKSIFHIIKMYHQTSVLLSVICCQGSSKSFANISFFWEVFFILTNSKCKIILCVHYSICTKLINIKVRKLLILSLKGIFWGQNRLKHTQSIMYARISSQCL